jgi:tetratricopeptide (TPR) repeat protein
VLEVKQDAQRLLVGMKYESLTEPAPDADRTLRLGLVSHPSSMPQSYAAALEVRDRGVAYNQLLEKTGSFVNPTGVEVTKELGLPFKAGKASLFVGMMNGYDPGQSAEALRKEQNAQMALKHVTLGVKYFKTGNNIEAFQCLNKALSIDKYNVEALVARGALYANNGSLEKAISDFELGLASSPDHKNAKKYLCETLVALARNHEDDQKYELALETFFKVLKINPDHSGAKEGVWIVKQKHAGIPSSQIR